ncbi:uncharacterized protein [Parasteatoda tepidariorum]|uniref:uncharacterized protein n=1 Tax=Parasteatoda tepidariorum TaxID=114398 RepID=UPI001C71C49B|nr:dynein regulatory complex subunit 4-like [Parasteatoda tepidariorum]
MPVKHKSKKKDKSYQIHDINFMSRTELKSHISNLESEMRKMRIDLRIHTMHNSNLSSFLSEKQEDYFFAIQSSATTGRQVIDSVEKLKHRLKEANMKTEFLKLRQNREHNLEQHNKYLSILIGYDKDMVKKKERRNVERKFEEDQCLSMMATKYMADHDFFSKFDKLPQALTFSQVSKIRKSLQDCSVAKKHIQDRCNIYSLHDQSFEGFPTNVASKMKDYFHDLSHYSIKAIRILEAKVNELQEKFWCITRAINKALEENKNIKERQNRDLELERSRIIKQNRSNAELKNSTELDKLLLRNEELTQELGKSKTGFKNLKSLFLSSVSKFYEKAEYRAFVAEEILQVALAIEKYKSDVTVIEREQTNGELGHFSLTPNRQNLTERLTKLKLKIQNSNTLFIPPQFH